MDRHSEAAQPGIILANEPRAYRDVIAGALRHLHPRLAVTTLEPAELVPHLRRAGSSLVIYSEPDPAVEAGAPAWVLLYPGGANHSVISLDGRRTTVADLQFHDLLALVERALPAIPPAAPA